MTRKLWTSFAGIIVVMLLCIFYITNNILHVNLTGSPIVTVEMPASGGLFASSPVVYRGTTIGRVERMDLVGDHVEAKFSLRTSLDIPANTKAMVRSLSPAGEQYLDLQPQGNEGPYLKNGSRISATSVSIPETVANGLETIKKVLDQVDTTTLKTVLDELSTGFTGTAGDLHTMLTSSENILNTLQSVYPQTQRTLQNLHTILKTGIDEAGNLRTFATSAKTLATWLKSYDPRLQQLLDSTPGQMAQVDGLVTQLSQVLPSALSNGMTLADILAVRDPHLREFFVQWPPAFTTLAKSFQGNRWRLDLELGAQKVCNYSTPRQAPTSTQNRPLVTDARCTGSAINNFPRGAAFAPGPTQ